MESSSRCASLFWVALQLAAIVARVARRSRTRPALHAVDARLDMAGRLGDAVGLAIDQGDDVGDVADRVVDPAEAALRDAALLDAGLDLARSPPRPRGSASRWCRAISLVARARVVGELLHLGGDDREAAPGLAGARRLDGGVEREHVGLAGDRLDRGGDAAAPGVIASAKPAMRSPSWTTSSVRPEKIRIVSSIAPRP